MVGSRPYVSFDVACERLMFRAKPPVGRIEPPEPARDALCEDFAVDLVVASVLLIYLGGDLDQLGLGAVTER